MLGFPIGEPGEPHAVKMVGATKSEVVTTIRRNTFLAGAGKKRIDILLRQGVVPALGCKSHMQNFGEIPIPTKWGALKDGPILQM